jgi:hypothetical protein
MLRRICRQLALPAVSRVSDLSAFPQSNMTCAISPFGLLEGRTVEIGYRYSNGDTDALTVGADVYWRVRLARQGR